MAKRYDPVVFVDYPIDKETEKAVYCEVKSGYASNTTKYMWIPKSVCETQIYVQTVDNDNNPERFGYRVITVKEWFYDKNIKRA